MLAVANRSHGPFCQEDVEFLQPFILTATSILVSRRNYVNRRKTEDDLYKAYAVIEKKVEELKRSKEIAEEAVEEKNQLIANISHDTCTPLNCIMYVCFVCLSDFVFVSQYFIVIKQFTNNNSGVQSLLKTTCLTREQLEYINMTENSANILLTLVKDILNYSKLEANVITLDQKEFDLQEAIEDVLDMCALKGCKSNVKIENYYDTAIPSSLVIGDKNRLSIVIQNIVGNALKVRHRVKLILITRIFSLQALVKFLLQQNSRE